jgi:hypothetical protein
VSLCSHCGHEHESHVRTCPHTGKAIGPTPVPLAKTMFGVGSPPFPPVLPPPSPPVPKAPSDAGNAPEGNVSFGALPLSTQKPAGSASSKTLLGVPTPSPILQVTNNTPTHSAVPSAEENRSLTPVDLPKIGTQKPLPLPSLTEEVARLDSFPERLLSSARSVLELVNWSVGIYARFPKTLFLLVAMVVLPASFFNACVRVGISAWVTPTLDPAMAFVDFSARRAELAERISKHQAAGQVDQQAIAELAALASVIRTPEDSSHLPISGMGWFEQILLAVVAGLLISGFAYPMALGVCAIAAADRQSGSMVPKATDILGIIARRWKNILGALLPAAILTALGYVFFVIPGLVLSVVFVFVPIVVLFERRNHLGALKRSVQLVTMDVSRVAILLLGFALSVFAISLFIALFSGPTDSRALSFVRSIVGDVLVAAVLPVPSLALARIYLDLRKREGDAVGDVARGARE